MKTCGLQILIMILASMASLQASADWNFFGANDDTSAYQSNASGTIYVRVNAANFRSAPFVDGSSVFGTFSKNTALRVIRKDSYSDSGTWYFVIDGRGHTGWVNSHLVSKRPTTESQPSQARVASQATPSAPIPKPRPARHAAPAASTPAPTSASDDTRSAPAAAPATAAPWPAPVRKQSDSSVFPPPPDFSVGPKNEQTAQAPAQPASTEPAKPASTPTAQTSAAPAPSAPKPAPAQPVKPEEKKPVAKKSSAPANGCLTHYPSQNYDEKSGDEATWERQHDLMKQIQAAIGGKMANASYANQQSSGLDIKVSFSPQARSKSSSAPIILNFTGGLRGMGEPQTIHVGAKICVNHGVITAELTDNTSKSQSGKLTIKAVPNGFSATGNIKTADGNDVSIDETLSRTSR